MHKLIARLTAGAILVAASNAAADGARTVTNFKDKTSLGNTLDNWDGAGKKIDAFMLTTAGEWLMTTGASIAKSSSFSTTLSDKINTKLAAGKRAVTADCNEVGGCIVVYDDWSSSTLNDTKIPSCFASSLASYKSNSWNVLDVEITETACVFLGTGGQATYSANLDPELKNALADRKSAGRTIEALSINFDQNWALVADHNPMSSGIKDTVLHEWLAFSSRSGFKKANQLVMGIGDDYIWQGVTNDPRSKTTPIGNIEWGLGSGSTNIWDRMNALGVTGLSVGIIADSPTGPNVKWARGYGSRRADDDLAILGKTPFALASLSKYLGALTIASQVEADTSVSAGTDIFSGNILPSTGALKKWQAEGKVRAPSCSGIADDTSGAFRCHLQGNLNGVARGGALVTPISLNCLMTHTCSIASEVNGASVIKKHHWAANANKSTLTWLSGRSCNDEASDCDPWGNQTWQDLSPIGTFAYASANYLVAQAYIEDRVGNTTAGAQLQTRVLDKVGMPNTTYPINMTAAQQAEVAWKHSVAGVPDAEMATTAWVFGGGIWSSAIDYANAMIVALNQGKAANGTQVLLASTVNKVLLKAPSGSTVDRGWGLVYEGTKDITEGTRRAFNHGGSKAGALSQMCANPTANEGIVILVNSKDDATTTLINEIQAAYNAMRTTANWNAADDCN